MLPFVIKVKQHVKIYIYRTIKRYAHLHLLRFVKVVHNELSADNGTTIRYMSHEYFKE